MVLKSKFRIFNDIGPVSEDIIYAAGIYSWNGFLESEGVSGLTQRLYESTSEQIKEWSNALEMKDAKFFATNLQSSMHWMLLKEFQEHVCYLDIETTGLYRDFDKVTVVGIYDGHSFQNLVRGRGLSKKAIQKSLSGCKLLVTYYGSCFDLPFLQSEFYGIDLNIPHFDLCFGGRKVGLTGGLKKIERRLGISRDSSISSVDGFEAVTLWYSFQKGNEKSLKKLLDYCMADTINLSKMAPLVFEKLNQLETSIRLDHLN
uniref:Ammonia permease n=1 Tax=uncultured marine group II/III euryarchaeote KM3_92_B07 TaxID=1456543 RepID=A0A075HYI8_9EURY|nr:Ammonia permease [uncultured marine group II/III euryarchaeote KM3_92_B07]